MYHVKFSVSDFFPCDLDVGFKVSTNFIKTLVVKMTEKLPYIIKSQKTANMYYVSSLPQFLNSEFQINLEKV